MWGGWWLFLPPAACAALTLLTAYLLGGLPARRARSFFHSSSACAGNSRASIRPRDIQKYLSEVRRELIVSARWLLNSNNWMVGEHLDVHFCALSAPEFRGR